MDLSAVDLNAIEMPYISLCNSTFYTALSDILTLNVSVFVSFIFVELKEAIKWDKYRSISFIFFWFIFYFYNVFMCMFLVPMLDTTTYEHFENGFYV